MDTISQRTTVHTSNRNSRDGEVVVNPFLEKITEKSLEDQASCLSRWTLSYLTQLMKLWTQKVLESEDCGAPSKNIARTTHLIKSVRHGKTKNKRLKPSTRRIEIRKKSQT